MANFMGPMAPPQAAPSQPPQLDVRTNPSQRAQFKSFMQGMNRPVMPPTTAPVAPMLPAPSPMDDIDIFAPAPMANGGVVGGLQSLGEMSGQMVDALNTVVYGGSQGGGMPSSGGIGGPMSSGGGFGGGQMPAPLPPITTLPPGATPPALQSRFPPAPPPIGAAPKLPDRLSLNDMSLLGMPTPAYMPMDPDGDGVDQFSRPMESQLSDEQRAQAERDQQERLKNLRSRFAEGGAFGSGSMGSPLSRLGVMGGLGSIFGYEDGGPVGMQRGGVTFKSGERFESGRGIAEQQRERAAAARGEDPGEEAGIDRGFPDFSEQPITKDDPITQTEVDAAFGVSNQRPTGGITLRRSPPPKGDVSSAELLKTLDPVTQNLVMNPPADSIASVIAGDKTQQFDDALGKALGVAPVTAPPIDMPSADPMNDLLFGERRIDVPIIDPRADVLSVTPMEQFALGQFSKMVDALNKSGEAAQKLSMQPIETDPISSPTEVEDTSVGGPLAEAGSSVDRLMVTPITNLRGGGQRTAGEDLTMRSESGIAKKLPQNIIENINKGRPAVIDARSGQITGYVGEGLFGIGNAYTGRPGYDPFGPNATFDQARNAYIVQPDIMGNVGAPTSDDRVLATPAVPASPAQAPATPNPPMITPPDNPLFPAPPQDVVVPSPRGPVNIGAPVLSAPNIAPVQPVGLPQSFLDLLANFNRPAPVAMQDGGAVLDKAADNFLEALKVA